MLAPKWLNYHVCHLKGIRVCYATAGGGEMRKLIDNVAVIEDKHNWQETLAKVSKGIWTRIKLPRLEKDFPRCSQDSVRPGEVQVKRHLVQRIPLSL